MIPLIFKMFNILQILHEFAEQYVHKYSNICLLLAPKHQKDIFHFGWRGGWKEKEQYKINIDSS